MERNQAIGLVSCYAGESISLPKGSKVHHAILDGGDVVLSYSAPPTLFQEEVELWWVEMRESFTTGEAWQPVGVGRLYKQNLVIAVLRLEEDDEDTQEDIPKSS